MDPRGPLKRISTRDQNHFTYEYENKESRDLRFNHGTELLNASNDN